MTDRALRPLHHRHRHRRGQDLRRGADRPGAGGRGRAWASTSRRPAAAAAKTAKLVSDDAVALWEAAGRPGELDRVCPQRFAAPLAPHLAAGRKAAARSRAAPQRPGLLAKRVRRDPGRRRRRADVAAGRRRVRGRPGRTISASRWWSSPATSWARSTPRCKR